MIQEEFWLTRLAEATAIRPESSEILWGAFVTQLEQRLLAGSSLYFPGLCAWELEEHREFVAHTSDGKYWLIPPRLTLCLVSEDERSSRSVSILLLSEILTQQTQLPTSSVGQWLTNVCQLTKQLLDQGATIQWPRLGSLRAVQDTSGHCVAFEFLPQESFIGLLNKPFSMFAPVEVNEASASADLLIEEHQDLGALYPVLPQRVSLLPSPAEDPVIPEASTPSEVPASPIPSEEAHPLPEPEATPSAEPEEAIVEAPIELIPSEEVTPPEVLLPPSEAPEDEASPEERPNKLFWLLLASGTALSILLLLFLLGLSSGGEKPARPLLPPSTDSVPEKVAVPHDTLPAPDTLPASQVDTLPLPTPAPTESVRPVPEAERTEQVRLHAGDRLSRLALKKYGHKAFWVYIYQENRSKLSDPDNIPVGMTITLPPASKYRIDAQDTNSVNRALLLQRSLLKN